MFQLRDYLSSSLDSREECDSRKIKGVLAAMSNIRCENE
jgi:hypothetical protein